MIYGLISMSMEWNVPTENSILSSFPTDYYHNLISGDFPITLFIILLIARKRHPDHGAA